MLRLEYKYIVAIVATIGLSMELLDTTVVNVAIPVLAKDFDARPTTIEWVITGYLLSLAVCIPISGWAGDRFGTKRTFIAALFTFTAASLLCALAWNVASLSAFRVLQGIGGGMMTPVGQAMLFRVFPPHERAKASAFMVIPVSIAPASGPIVGGFLIDYVSWQSIFIVNLPIGVLGILFCMRFLKEHKEPEPGSFDTAGFTLVAVGMASLLYAFSEAGARGLGDNRVLIFGGVGLVALAAFVAVELRTREPMLDLRLFANRLYRACSVVQFTAMIGFASALFLLPIFLQAERGLSAFESGLTTFPMAIGVIMTAQPATRVYHRIGPRRLIIAGLAVSALSTFMLAAMDTETSLWLVRGILLIRGWGFGLMLVALQAATYATVPTAKTGRATSIFSSGQMVGQSFGVAVIATVLAHQLRHYGGATFLPPGAPDILRDATVMAFRDGFIVSGVVLLVGAAVALLVRDSDAAPSMRKVEAIDEAEPVPALLH